MLSILLLNMIYLITAVIFIGLQRVIHANNDLVINLPEGKIRGHLLQSEKGAYYAFQEIPYASPPLGNRRFQVPEAVEPWDGILETTKNTKMCIQTGSAVNSTANTGDPVESEDCLYLNIYSPHKPAYTKLLPVLVWIHGGGYAIGSGMYGSNGPKYFMDYGIIVVTINYRLGPLGFLTTMDGVIPGNLGLKDQKMALQWLKSRINLFGGDPEKITISGESVGAMAVGFLLLANGTEGLFRGIIQQSGSPLNREGFTQYARHYAFQLGSFLDPNINHTSSSEALLDLLQKASVSDIMTATNNISSLLDYSVGCIMDMAFAPVLEDKTLPNPLVTEPMLQALLDGNYNQVPALLGFNSEESIYFYSIVDASFQQGIKETLDSLPETLIGPELNVSKEHLQEMSLKLKEIYTSTDFTSDEAAFLKISSDAGFTNGIIKQAQVTSRHVPVYLYQFSYSGGRGEIRYANRTRPDITGAEGVGHTEDLPYLWEYGFYYRDKATKDYMISNRLLKLWANFVKYQNPTPGFDESLDNIFWPKVDCALGKIEFSNINDEFSVESDPRYFYEVDELYQAYVRKPYLVY